MCAMRVRVRGGWARVFSPYLYLDVIRFLAFLRTTIPERRAGGACPGRVWETGTGSSRERRRGQPCAGGAARLSKWAKDSADAVIAVVD